MLLYKAIIFLPLIGCLIVAFFGKQLGAKLSEYITTGLMLVVAVLSWIVFFNVALGSPEGLPLKVDIARWIQSGGINVSWTLRIDTLTAVMFVVVNTVSALVHVYSIGYMHDDPHRPRFFAYLSLFTFAMLALVTSDNLAQMFFGWEGVGLASYLLIGFWYEKPSANAAAMKAFIANRVGDFGFLLGICGLFVLFGSINFDVIFANAQGFAAGSPTDIVLDFCGLTLSRAGALTTVCLLLFMGAMGKSAQFLLHTWLPDAMEGPTPVSALIHAATMVTAGVFLVARMSPIFELSHDALTFVTLIGAITAFFAATVGLVQNDIKRVIAYSTCSQLGYMFVALGVGAYGPAIFHLFTHAFFKALLFLCAGSVIHSVGGEQDMRKMGGLRTHIPKTFWMMIIGTLAITGVGIPFTPIGFAGFFSKDAIIEAAYAGDNAVAGFAFTLLVIAALFTAFYSWRLIFMTFFNKPRASHDVMHHVHESPNVMLVPLYVLAIGAVLAGTVFYSHFVGEEFKVFWKGALRMLAGNHVMEDMEHVPVWVSLSPFIAMLLGTLTAWYFYIKSPETPKRLAAQHHGLYQFLLNKWYFDELYDFLFVRSSKWLGRVFWQKGDIGIIDHYGPNGVAARVLDITNQVVRLQTGYLYHYAFAMLLGIAALVTWMMLGEFYLMTDWPILSTVIFLPMVGVLLLLLMTDNGPAGRQNVMIISLATTVVTFIVSLFVWFGFDGQDPGFQLIEQYSWLARGITYHVGVDGISVGFVVLAAFLMPFGVLTSWNAITLRVRDYMIAFLVLETVIIGVFCSLDIVLFYLFFEASLIPMFLIIGVWGGPRRIYASLKFFLYTLLGSIFMLIAIIVCYSIVGTTSIPELLAYKFSPEVQFWLWLAFFASFAIKVPMWPFHTWLPDAHVEAPTAGSVDLAALLLKFGGYGFLRFSLPMFPNASEQFAPLILTLSVIAIVYASLVALVQTDIKKMIAYSSVAHMGYVTMGIFAVNQQGIHGALFQMLSHGVISGALFLCVGIVYERTHTRDISAYSGIVSKMPTYAIAMMIFTMANVGLPGTSGFVGEFLATIGIFRVSTLTGVLATLGIILSAGYMLWLYARMIFGKPDKPAMQPLLDLSIREKFIVYPLIVVTIFFGFYPAPVFDVSAASVNHIVYNYNIAVHTAPAAPQAK